jgi:hypothetical protein
LIPDWTAQLAGTDTSEQVLEAVRGFLKSRPRRFLSELPNGCQPSGMESAQDVSSYAFVLKQAQCTVKDDLAAGFLEMARFFAAASQRLAEILTPRGFTLRTWPESPSPR